MSKACRVFYTRSVDTDVSGQGNISPVEDLLPDACAEPTQKKMSSGAPFYIYERKDPTIYASAIMTIDTFSYKKPQQQGGEPFCVLQPRVDQLLLAPVTDAYQQAAGSYVDRIKEESGYKFFHADAQELDRLPSSLGLE